MIAYQWEMGGPKRYERGTSHHTCMLTEGFLYLHSAEVPKTTKTTTTLLFVPGRWRQQQREALYVPVRLEARRA